MTHDIINAMGSDLSITFRVHHIQSEWVSECVCEWASECVHVCSHTCMSRPCFGSSTLLWRRWTRGKVLIILTCAWDVFFRCPGEEDQNAYDLAKLPNPVSDPIKPPGTMPRRTEVPRGRSKLLLDRLMMMSWCLMSSDVIWHIRDKLWPMPKHGSIKATYVRCMRV